ncbi:N-acetylneuraminate synthase family protein [Flammeovirgaceae bacterium SG7u.111]|nr:N-acetylneuraminate synthase family protein [Flammeovirgaceae bacterium SG7u.132]WPO34965.1 N-acetylneuraminate synthase family protein [Flammeovirgaceae bacterium SG7u.111]
MFIDRNIKSFVIYEETSIVEALKILNARKGRILIVVTDKDIVLGLITNGDILRSIMNAQTPDLQKNITSIANQNFKYVYEDYNNYNLHSLLQKYTHIPILNTQKQLVAVARNKQIKEAFFIDKIEIGNTHTFIIAEVGNNHNGSIELAKQLVDYSIQAGADCVKFQMRNLKELYSNAGDASDSRENLGTQYTLDLLNRFQLSEEELIEVFDYCKEKKIIPLCTPWDISSLNTLENYGMPAYKVASADLTNHKLLQAIAKTGKPIICSTGMSSENEIIQTVELLNDLGANFILLHCNSTYPAPFEDINLSYIKKLQKLTNSFVGYSGHERGIYVSIAAVALGAKVLERHITIDKTMEGNDHKVSLLPTEFEELVKGVRIVEKSLGASTSESRIISQGEMINRVTLAKSLIINQDLKEGGIIEDNMIEVRSPGRGLQPNYRSKLLGKKAKHSFKKGDFFFPSDILEEVVTRRKYNFKRPWGIPVRYADYQELIKETNLDFVEFHLSYKDLEVDFSKFITKPQNINFAVHSPELFAGDHILDLCALDKNYRERSIKELQKVIYTTKKLNKLFSHTKRPLIVTNVGGWTQQGFLSEKEKKEKYKILEESLSLLDCSGVEIVPQTMPPFPWHFGGQSYHNLFVEAEEICDFCEKNKMRICLDISHSKLAATHLNTSFHNFLKQVAPIAAHLHIADADKASGEGLQIGTGSIDFITIAEVLNSLAPEAWFIPEIWQGHENKGEGFWIALEKLEKYLTYRQTF